MAKISSTSRAPTASAPARTTRQTRSQSAEPSATAPEPATTGASRRRRAPNSRAGSEQPAAGRNGRKTKNAPTPVPDLTTVEEAEDVEDDRNSEIGEHDELQAHILAQSQAEVPTAYNRRRISTGSAISGTTAKTSFSAEEIEMMDAEIMIDELPSLADAAAKFASFLAPDGSNTNSARWKEIRSTGTKLSKLYHNRQAPFNFHKQSFGSQEYIRPRTVLRALLGVQSMDEVPDELWRPDNIFSKVNLAEMLNTVLVVCDTDEWTATGSDALERLHAAFPDAIAGREYNEETLAFYLDLTAQLTIRRMEASIESEPNFSPHSLIDNLFYDEDDTFRQMEGLGLTDANKADRDRALRAIKRTVADLKAPFKNQNGAGATAANGALKNKYRWDYLKMHTLKYYEQRTKQLDKRIDRASGIAQILRSLAKEVERRVNQKQADQIRRKSLQKPESTARASLSSIAALKQLAQGLIEQDSGSGEDEGLDEDAATAEESIPEQEPKPMEPAYTEPVVDNADADSVPEVIEQDFATSANARGKVAAQPAVRSELSISESFRERQLKRQQKSPQRPRGRFIDPQPNAVQLEWNEDPLTQHDNQGESIDQGTEFRKSESPKKKGKRTFMEFEEDEEEDDYPDPTQDEGFQTDTRDMATADRRRKEVAFAHKSRPSIRYPSIEPAGSAVAGPSNYASSTAPEGRASQSPNKRQRLNPGSSVMPRTQPAPEGADLSPNERYARAKVYARQHSAVNSMRNPQQQRRAWTREEENALIKLIEEYGGDGISYATLKNLDAALEDDAKLSYRSAEDLRFKARNMKVTFLLGNTTQDTLPRNWEYVMLDKKAIKKLHDNRINYTQERVRGVGLDF